MKSKTLAIVVSAAVLLSMSGAANSEEQEKKCGFSIELVPGNLKNDCSYKYKDISVTPGQINLYKAGGFIAAGLACTKTHGAGGCVRKALALIGL
jgi:hypothetical protein